MLIASPKPPMPPVTNAILAMSLSLSVVVMRLKIAELRAFHCQRHAHAAANAQARQPALGIAPDHLVQQGHQDAAARRADRMAESDRAAVDIDFAGVPAHLLVDCDGLCR